MSKQPPTPPGGLPAGVVVKHWGKMKPPSPKSGAQRLRPFGMRDTPFDPMTGKFLAMAAPGHENDKENAIIAQYLEEHFSSLVNNYLHDHADELLDLMFPDGTEGQVIYHDGKEWVASDLATLIAEKLSALGTATPTASDDVFIKTSSGLKWADAKECTT